MDTPATRHPAEHGLLESGYVVSVVRTADDIRTQILGDGYFIGLTLLGTRATCWSACPPEAPRRSMHN